MVVRLQRHELHVSNPHTGNNRFSWWLSNYSVYYYHHAGVTYLLPELGMKKRALGIKGWVVQIVQQLVV